MAGMFSVGHCVEVMFAPGGEYSQIIAGQRILQGELFGIRVQLPKTTWVFPKCRFVEFGPEDEWWARMKFPEAILVGCGLVFSLSLFIMAWLLERKRP